MPGDAAVIARLLAATGVTTLVNDRVDPLLTAERTAYPCVRVEEVDREPVSAFGSDVGLTRFEVEVECFATTPAGVKALALATRTALKRFRGSSGGVTVQDMLLEREVSDFEPEGNVYSVRQDFTVWTEEI